MAHVKAHFCELPPASLVAFVAADGVAQDAELDIRITPGQHCGVRVIHEDAQSVTLATLRGHPEAGRITFGAYRNPAGDVIFHIRSRARSDQPLKRLGFLAIGDAMQTNTWADFIKEHRRVGRCAHRRRHPCGHRSRSTKLPEDGEPLHSPTFLAAGD